MTAGRVQDSSQNGKGHGTTVKFVKEKPRHEKKHDIVISPGCYNVRKDYLEKLNHENSPGAIYKNDYNAVGQPSLISTIKTPPRATIFKGGIEKVGRPIATTTPLDTPGAIYDPGPGEDAIRKSVPVTKFGKEERKTIGGNLTTVTPGPGTSIFKSSAEEGHGYSFGVTAWRYNDSYKNPQKSAWPGPGDYKLEQKNGHQVLSTIRSQPQYSMTARNYPKLHTKDLDMPGPGEYKIDNCVPNFLVKTIVFGSEPQRPEPSNFDLKRPGPGEYQLLGAIGKQPSSRYQSAPKYGFGKCCTAGCTCNDLHCSCYANGAGCDPQRCGCTGCKYKDGCGDKNKNRDPPIEVAPGPGPGSYNILDDYSKGHGFHILSTQKSVCTPTFSKPPQGQNKLILKETGSSIDPVAIINGFDYCKYSPPTFVFDKGPQRPDMKYEMSIPGPQTYCPQKIADGIKYTRRQPGTTKIDPPPQKQTRRVKGPIPINYYLDFSTSGKLGKHFQSTQASIKTMVFGTGPKIYTPKDLRTGPGPESYKPNYFVCKEQVIHDITFAHSPQRPGPHPDDDGPGVGTYTQQNGIGRQISSKYRTNAAYSFGDKKFEEKLKMGIPNKVKMSKKKKKAAGGISMY